MWRFTCQHVDGRIGRRQPLSLPEELLGFFVTAHLSVGKKKQKPNVSWWNRVVRIHRSGQRLRPARAAQLRPSTAGRYVDSIIDRERERERERKKIKRGSISTARKEATKRTSLLMSPGEVVTATTQEARQWASRSRRYLEKRKEKEDPIKEKIKPNNQPVVDGIALINRYNR